jgi:D-glycero-D-manno-heptose 1,7-bisphosphate phosphatase
MLIILDRDGVINYESGSYIKSPQEWIPIPGSLEGMAKLSQAGHRVVIATNQSGLARGLFTEKALDTIHQKMLHALTHLGGSIEGIFYCPHHPDDHCNCRKPQPGLLLTIAEQLHVDLAEAICIGDSLRDIQAAQKANCRAILVLTGNGQKTLENELPGVLVFPDLAAVAAAILTSRLESL